MEKKFHRETIKEIGISIERDVDKRLKMSRPGVWVEELESGDFQLMISDEEAE